MLDMKKRAGYAALVLVLAASIVACSDEDDDSSTSTSTLEGGTTAEVPEVTSEAIQTYGQIVLASYEDSLTSAQALDTALQAFVADPTEDNLTAAKEAWLQSREPYLQTEVYRFYDGPIDNPNDGPEGLLNAWPLDEVYIDYVDGSPEAGIVNDANVSISEAELEALNEQGGEANVATGYHAIEFLLWGQDFNDDGPGERPFSDYVTDGTGTAANQNRRAEYLTTATSLMLSHLQMLIDAWATGGGNYREEMEAADPSEGLRRILTGMTVLSGFETGGERLQVALDSGDQEDEHSCFSDNTHRDMVQDVRGVANVYEGRYERLDGTSVSGPGIRAVVEAVDADLADGLGDKIAESLANAEALVPPFDQEIAAGNAEGQARVTALILSLQEQEALLNQVFELFTIEIPVVE